MGQEQSTTEKTQEYKQFLLQYSQEREATHPQFGSIKLFTHIQTNEYICLKKYFTKSDKELSNLVTHLRQRNTFEQDNLLKILAIHQQDQIKICSDQTSMAIIIQYYQENLSSEINIRKLNNKPYTEGHIWILLQQIIDPCTYLSERNVVHGDTAWMLFDIFSSTYFVFFYSNLFNQLMGIINLLLCNIQFYKNDVILCIKPSTLYLDENGCIKIAECCMLKDEINGYSKMILSQDKAYLSPILLKQYKELIVTPTHDPYKSDIYALGLTALSVILMEEVYDCFDYIQGIVLTDKLEQKFNRIKQLGYSQILIEFIKQLLLFDEQERPSWQMLKDFIDKYRDKIYNMIPFYQSHLNNQKSPRQSNQFNISPLGQNMIYLVIVMFQSSPSISYSKSSFQVLNNSIQTDQRGSRNMYK